MAAAEALTDVRRTFLGFVPSQGVLTRQACSSPGGKRPWRPGEAFLQGPGVQGLQPGVWEEPGSPGDMAAAVGIHHRQAAALGDRRVGCVQPSSTREGPRGRHLQENPLLAECSAILRAGSGWVQERGRPPDTAVLGVGVGVVLGVGVGVSRGRSPEEAG